MRRRLHLEVLLGLCWEAADDVCDNGDPGHAGLQVSHHLLKLGTRHCDKIIYLEIHKFLSNFLDIPY